MEGTIIIQDYFDSLLSLNALTKLTGSIFIRNAPLLIRFEALNLETITETFQMDRLQSMAMITVPKLASVKEMDLQILPILTHINMESLKDVKSLRLSDTALTRFSELDTKEMINFDVNNNRYLESLTVNAEVVTDSFHIGGNARTITVNMDQLRKANNITVNRVQTLHMANLEEVSNSVSFIETDLSLLSLPKLTRVGGTMRIADNRGLLNVTVNSLQDIGGGLLIVNNTVLSNVSFFTNLTVIGGGLDIEGNVQQTSWPRLKYIKGSASMISTNSNFDCNQWINGEISNAMRGGEIKCQSSRLAAITRGSPANNSTITSSSPSTSPRREASLASSLGVRLSTFWPLVLVGLLA